MCGATHNRSYMFYDDWYGHFSWGFTVVIVRQIAAFSFSSMLIILSIAEMMRVGRENCCCCCGDSGIIKKYSEDSHNLLLYFMHEYQNLDCRYLIFNFIIPQSNENSTMMINLHNFLTSLIFNDYFFFNRGNDKKQLN